MRIGQFVSRLRTRTGLQTSTCVMRLKASAQDNRQCDQESNMADEMKEKVATLLKGIDRYES